MLLFVYGTMLSTGRNFPRLWETGPVRIGDEVLTEDLFDMFLGHQNSAPCAIRYQFGHPVAGELYAVPEAGVLNVIDGCEGHPVVYRREPVRLLDFHLPVSVHMYVYVGRRDEQDRWVEPIRGALRFN